MGVRTSSDLFKRDNQKGIVHSGPKPMQTGLASDAIRAYRFPTPIQGVSHVSLDVGEIKDKKPVTTKIKLQDGVFEIPKSWTNDKKDKYSSAFIKAGFEDVSYNPVTKEKTKSSKPEKEYIYYAGHPDNKDDEKVNGEIAVEVNGEKIQLEVIEGVVAVESKDVYQALLEKGYYEAKPAEEIK